MSTFARYYILTEWVPGGSIHALLKKGIRLQENVVKAYVRQVPLLLPPPLPSLPLLLPLPLLPSPSSLLTAAAAANVA
jgi:serine/threonine protein kinase